MKKIIIALVLAALVLVPAFAVSNYQFKLAANISVDHETSIQFKSVGAYVGIPGEYVDANFGLMFSIPYAPEITGLYAEVLLNTLEYGLVSFKPGFAADVHLIDGQLKADVAAAAAVSFFAPYFPCEVSVMPKYKFVNMTGTELFGIEFGVESYY